MSDLDAIVRLGSVKTKPFHLARAADAIALASIAERLGLDMVKRFELDAELAAQAEGDVYLASGSITMVAERTCIATMETFDEETLATFEEYFTTARSKATSDEDAVDPDVMDIELLEEEQIDFGELAVQHAALALNPYPRGPNAPAVEADAEEEAAGLTPQRPFAGLDQLLQNARQKK